LIALRDVISTSCTRTGAFARFVPRSDGWIWLAETEADRVVRVQLAVAGRTAVKLPVGATAHSASWYVVRRLAGPGWFIAGDAATALDPASGSGIATALRSGLAAGAAAAQVIVENAHAGFIAARYHDTLSDEAERGARKLTASYRTLGISFDRNITTGDGATWDRRSASTRRKCEEVDGFFRRGTRPPWD
jgi:flavin-dependent dehydrogenase